MIYDIKKELTDNPYVDDLVYQVKILAYGCILKNEQEALKNETELSLRNSSIYMSCINGTATYSLLEYPKEMFEQLPTIQQPIKDAIISDKQNIMAKKVIYPDTNGVPVTNRLTDTQKQLIINTAIKYTIDNYIEYNNYYRKIAGLPDIGDPGIKLNDVIKWDFPENTISQDTINNKYIHEYDNAEILLLQEFGVLDKIIELLPEKRYLNYLYPKSIDFYTARKAYAFQVLYIPSIEQQSIYERFKEKLDLNREYTTKTIYSDAYKFNSDYYDAIIMVLIVVQTIIDMISEVQEIIANKEILDLRSIKYILESYGVPFFNEMPLKYQILLVQNINTLLKFKSTSKNIKDILTIFGFDDIMVYKYYLIKNRKTDADGNYLFNDNEIDNYDLNFVKVPITDNNPDEYLKAEENQMNYTEIIGNDSTWNGGLEESVVKNDILNQNFNYISTKYISIDTMYEMSKLCFQVPYFFNALFDKNKFAEVMTLKIESLSETHYFKLTDIFVYLFSLGHKYYGLDDNIIADGVVISHILGFNFDADMEKLKKSIEKSGYNFDTIMNGNKFIIPTSALRYEQFFDMINTNEKTLNFIKTKLRTANNKNEYDIYKKIYDTCMIKKYTAEYYSVFDEATNTNIIPTTYTDYLSYRDGILYNFLIEVDNLGFNSIKQQEEITKQIDTVLSSLFQYIDSQDYKYIFGQFPGGSAISMMGSYIYKVIDFFKSYKIDFLGANTGYTFTDRFDTGISYIDWMNTNTTFNKSDIIKYRDNVSMVSNIIRTDRMNIRDYIHIERTYN